MYNPLPIWIPKKQSKHTPLQKAATLRQDTEMLTLECRRIMEGIYSPAVTCFMLELAGRRGRLQQLRDLVAMGLEIDDVRRIIMAKTYYPAKLIVQLTSTNMTARDMAAFHL